MNSPESFFPWHKGVEWPLWTLLVWAGMSVNTKRLPGYGGKSCLVKNRHQLIHMISTSQSS